MTRPEKKARLLMVTSTETPVRNLPDIVMMKLTINTATARLLMPPGYRPDAPGAT